jgi:hypothetical protein
MKHISWQEYRPAHPPAIGNDYIIVYINSSGNREACRGSFNIEEHIHTWIDEFDKLIVNTVTHYAKLELP